MSSIPGSIRIGSSEYSIAAGIVFEEFKFSGASSIIYSSSGEYLTGVLEKIIDRKKESKSKKTVSTRIYRERRREEEALAGRHEVLAIIRESRDRPPASYTTPTTSTSTTFKRQQRIRGAERESTGSTGRMVGDGRGGMFFAVWGKDDN